MKSTKKIFGALLATVALVVPMVTFAATLNNDPRDFATLRVANNTTNPTGCTTCWSGSANASQGDTVSFAVYYHNTGPDTATNVRVRLIPQVTSAGNSHTFTATVSADNAPSVTGTATVSLSSSQTITYNGTTYWYPYNSNPTTSANLPSGQTGEELFNGVGLNIGNVAPGWTTQGSVTANFTVSTTQQNNEVPTVVTNSATGVSQTSATLNGSVNPNGSNSTATFEWGTTQSFGTVVQVGSQGSGTSPVNISGGLWNLTPNTTYYFRAVATNAQGTAQGQTLSFTTSNNPQNSTLPTITTNSATSVSQNSASLNGYVNPNGTTNTTRWFEWGTSYSNLNNTTTHYTHGTNADGFTTTINGLSSNTTYYFRAVAQNSQGTVQGSTLSFYTSGNGNNQNQPTVTTQAATDTSSGYAVLNGYVDPNGTSDTTRWFEWGPNNSSNMYNQTTHYNQGSVSGSFSSSISGLSQNSTYYYRAVAQNSQGTVYGNTISFTNGGNCNSNGWYGDCGDNNNLVTVNTRNADTSSTFAALNGYVDPNGSGDTVHWFEWGSNYSLGQSTQYVSQGNSASSFSTTVSGLNPNSTYYYRAAARSSAGTVYGSILSFTTIYTAPTPNPIVGTSPTVTTLLATGITRQSAVLNGLVYNSNGVSANAWFEWGTNTSLSNKTQSSVVGNLAVARYADTITGLSSGQTYYYRIVAENIYGRVYGSTLSFTADDSTVVINNPPQVITRTVTVVNNTGVGIGSLVDLKMDGGNDTIAKGEKRVYHVTWENISKQTLKNVVLRVTFPQAMSIDSATRGSYAPTDNAVVVEIGTLAPAEKGETFIFAVGGESLVIGQLAVVTANLVYTVPTGTQGDAIAYVTHRVVDSVTYGLGASIFGSGSFLPTTLLGWVIILILVLVLVLIGNHVYGRFAENK